MRQAADILTGKADPSTYRVTSYGDGPDALGIRLRLGLSQVEFASRYGFSLDTLRKWEQKTRRPSGAARVLLQVIDKNPDAVTAALAVGGEQAEADMNHHEAVDAGVEAFKEAGGPMKPAKHVAKIGGLKARRAKARTAQKAVHRKVAAKA